MYQEKIFEVKTRKEIYKFIMKNPGMHYRDIARFLKIPSSTMRYHLNYLERRNFISKEIINGYLRYIL